MAELKVLIIGAGPAGLVAALHLYQRGASRASFTKFVLNRLHYGVQLASHLMV